MKWLLRLNSETSKEQHRAREHEPLPLSLSSSVKYFSAYLGAGLYLYANIMRVDKYFGGRTSFRAKTKITERMRGH